VSKEIARDQKALTQARHDELVTRKDAKAENAALKAAQQQATPTRNVAQLAKTAEDASAAEEKVALSVDCRLL
jgi:hypothetical protein